MRKMDASVVDGQSIPLFSELKSDPDSLLLLNDSSLSQQIEFILSPTPSPPPQPQSQPQSQPQPQPPALAPLSLSQLPKTLATIFQKKINDEMLAPIHELNGIDLLKSAAIKLEKIDEEIKNEREALSATSIPALSFIDDKETKPPISSSTIRTSTVINLANLMPINSSNKSTETSTIFPIDIEATINKNGVVEYRCTECLEKFDNKELFQIHNSGHANNNKCAICNMVLKSLKNYEKHCLRCKPYECQICGRIVRFRPNFIKHMRVHTTQQSQRHKYKCDVCYKEFMSFEYFKVHKKIHNENINLTCGTCGKVFSALASLRGHSKLHSGVKMHKCDVCDKLFGQRYNLKIHHRTHTGKFPFACKICKKKLHTQSSLQTHMQTHQKDQMCQTVKIKYEPIEAAIIKLEVNESDLQIIESLTNTAEVLSTESYGCESVIRNYVQTEPQGIYAQKVQQNHSAIELSFDSNINAIETISALPSVSSSTASIELCSVPCNSPSVAETAVAIKCEPTFYSSGGDNSVEMLIKQEIFDDCSPQPAPVQESPPLSKFHSNFDSDLVDSNDLTNDLAYSNLFEPNSSISHSIPDDIYPDDDDFEMIDDHAYFGLQNTTDGNYIKKGWVYHTNSNYSVSSAKFNDDMSSNDHDHDHCGLGSDDNFIYE